MENIDLAVPVFPLRTVKKSPRYLFPLITWVGACSFLYIRNSPSRHLLIVI